MKFYILSVTFFLLASCGILPSNQGTEQEKPYERKVEYIFNVNADQDKSYREVNSWLAKKLRNSKYAIQLQDDKQKLIISKMATSCNTYNSSIEMNFNFEAKNKRVRIVFENISAIGSGSALQGLFPLYPSRQSQLDDFKSNCLDSYISEIKKAIDTPSKDW